MHSRITIPGLKFDHTRDEWTRKGPARALSATTHGHVEVHNDGTDRPAIKTANIPSALSGYRSYQVNDLGWRDIFYSAGLDVHTGELWEMRGAGWISTTNRDGKTPFTLLLIGDFETGSNLRDFPKAIARITQIAQVIGGTDKLDWHKRRADRDKRFYSTCPGQMAIPVLEEIRTGKISPDRTLLKPAAVDPIERRELLPLGEGDFDGDGPGGPVTVMQQWLGEFYTGKIDGDYGPVTTEAVREFARAQGITKPSGFMGQWLWNRLVDTAG